MTDKEIVALGMTFGMTRQEIAELKKNIPAPFQSNEQD
jgi:hypothetical protein